MRCPESSSSTRLYVCVLDSCLLANVLVDPRAYILDPRAGLQPIVSDYQYFSEMANTKNASDTRETSDQ